MNLTKGLYIVIYINFFCDNLIIFWTCTTVYQLKLHSALKKNYM